MNAFLVDGVRTPIGNFGGTFGPCANGRIAHVLAELMRRNPSLDPSSVGDVLMGCANQAGEDNRNVARMASLLAGLPQEVPGETVNRLCASGLAAATHAARMLHVGDASVVVAGGVEHMTRGPWVMSKTSKAFADMTLHDTSFGGVSSTPSCKRFTGRRDGQTAETRGQWHFS